MNLKDSKENLTRLVIVIGSDFDLVVIKNKLISVLLFD